MPKGHRNKLVAGAAALLAVSGGAAAAAATGTLSPKEESQAVLSDAAERLGVEPAELNAALKGALKNRVDAAVASGRLTEEQGEALKSRIDADEYPLVGLGPGGPGHGHVVHLGGLDAAASYLGMTEDELREALSDGKSLAEVAGDEGKSVDGLVDAMVAAATRELEQAVKDGRLTEERKQSLLSGLEERIADLVNGRLPAVRDHGPPPADSGWTLGPSAEVTAA